MKALYIHGYQSSPLPEKVNILKENFSEVISPQIDWDNENERQHLFENFVSLIKEKEITHVIGSSMGGQMAFYLASFCGLNCLVFNPAFGLRFNDLNLFLGSKSQKKTIIVLGKNDDVVPNETTTNFLNVNNITGVDIQYLEIGHQINLEVFQNSIKNLIS
jgi:predicted esterase YcpF (UPF0227 family)